MHRHDPQKSPNPLWQTFIADEQLHAMAPLTRAPIKGWIKIAFWILRVYIVALLALVAIGLYRQS